MLTVKRSTCILLQSRGCRVKSVLPVFRYRSITKQFFRKADGVVVMYEITAQQSFTAVRQWLGSVQVCYADETSNQ